MSEHFIEKCRCGRVLNQCRCINPNKKVIVSKEPCKHVVMAAVKSKKEK